MKILMIEWYRDWRGSDPQRLRTTSLSLDNEKVLFGLVVSIGNGDYDEVCIETDSMETVDCIRGLLQGTGGAKLVGWSMAAEQCRLFRMGYEVYRQGSDAYYFLNPFPRVGLFDTPDMANYLAEFRRS